jgi:YD repeat-containing protein
MILTVHDELRFEAPKAKADEMSALVRDKMQSAANLDVPPTVAVGIGESWKDAKRYTAYPAPLGTKENGMTRRMAFGLALAMVTLLARASGQDAPPADGDPPTLVIVGTGISAEIGGSHAKTDQMLYHTLGMFHAGAKGMKPTSVRFEGADAHFTLSMPTVEDGRVVGSHREEVSYPASSADPAAMREAAKIVAGQVARNRQAIVAMDMDLGGKQVVAAKSVGTIGAMAANLIRNLTPGANRAYEFTLAATGQPDVPHDFRDAVDAVKTSWDTETARAAIFMEETARAFKAQNGPNARVILVGHSAFTDAIDQVPLRAADGSRLVDTRVLSSERPRPPRESDPDHTIFIAHGNDLPPTRMGNPLSPNLNGDLKGQGTIVTLEGYSYAGWDDKPLILAANALSPVSPTMEFVAGLANESKQLAAHTVTHYYTSTFDMTVCRDNDCVQHRGTPADIVRLQTDAALTGASSSNAVLRSLDAERPKESPVGGISLTKPAEVPVAAAEVSAVSITSGDPARLTLELRSGGRLQLPAVDPGVLAAAVKCVFGEGRGPELSLEPGRLDDKLVMSVRYVCNALGRTPLATLMLKADHALGAIAFGNEASYTAPAIEHYEPYMALALDDPRMSAGALTGRVWMVPSAARLTRDGDQLRVADVTSSIRFEFWDPTKTMQYLAGAKIGMRTPAGDYLGAQLTREMNDNSDAFREIAALRNPIALVGTLLWARAAGLRPTSELTESAEAVWTAGLESYSLPEPAEQVTRDGVVYHVVSIPDLRTIDAGTLPRPAVIFGPSGPTRYLWEDGGESRLEYADGRIVALTDRGGQVSRIVYDNQGDLQGIVGPTGTGVVLIPDGDTSILAAGVSLDLATRHVTIPQDAVLAVEGSPRGFLDRRLGQWLALERANAKGDWLVVAASTSSRGDSGSGRWWLIGIGIGVVVTLVSRKRSALRARYLKWSVGSGGHGAKQMAAAAELAVRDDESAVDSITRLVRTAPAAVAREAIERVADTKTSSSRAVLSGLVADHIHGDEAARALDRVDPAWRSSVAAHHLVPPLLAALRSPDPARRHAIEALGRLRAAEAVPSLIEGLAGPYGWAEESALAEIGLPAVESLLRLLAEQGDERRKHAKETLARIPSWRDTAEARAAVSTLLEALGHRYSLIREDSVRALGQIGDARALHRLIDALQDEKDRVRGAAVEALGNLGDVRAVPALRSIFDNTGSVAAASALARLGQDAPDVVSKVVKSGGTNDAVQVLDRLASMDEATILEPQVLGALLDRLLSDDDDVRRKAYETLHSLPRRWRTEAVTQEFAARAIASAPPLAAHALREIGDSVVPQLVAALNERFSETAFDALKWMETPAALPAFRLGLSGVRHSATRGYEIIDAMVKHRDVASLDVLLDETEHDQLCSEAVTAIGTILQHNARAADERVLRRAAMVEDRDWTEYIPYTGPCNFEGQSHARRLDCGRIRQLARQELIRRGLAA